MQAKTTPYAAAHTAVVAKPGLEFEPKVVHCAQMNYQGRITIESGKCGGRPCIRGMRITVYDVLSYLASGMSAEEVLRDFPYLETDDIKACLLPPQLNRC